MRPAPEDNYFTGASYISVPAMVTDGGGGQSAWLQAEGVLGLVWGGGEWFAKGWSGPGATRRKRRRGIVSEEKGTVYATAPRSWVYPNSITVNGTEYTSGNTSALEYASADGTRLAVLADGD